MSSLTPVLHSKAKLLLLSTSTLHGGKYLQYAKDQVAEHFYGISQLLFIPFARPSGISNDDYTSKVAEFFAQLRIEVKGLHQFQDVNKAIKEAQGIFTGGGNTFLLLKTLQQLGALEAMKERIISGSAPYMGSSAGTNLAGLTINNTNDMPIVWPENLNAMGLVPFNFNPHYLDPVEGSTHMGETWETRIMEFHSFSNIPVVGLREGSFILVKEGQIQLKGSLTARLFRKGKNPLELSPGIFNLSLINS